MSAKTTIGRHLLAIVDSVALASPPPDQATERGDKWRLGWLMAGIIGYCQTELGVAHQSGEDSSGWREDGERMALGWSAIGASDDAMRRAREGALVRVASMTPEDLRASLDRAVAPEGASFEMAPIAPDGYDAMARRILDLEAENALLTERVSQAASGRLAIARALGMVSEDQGRIAGVATLDESAAEIVRLRGRLGRAEESP